MSDCFVFHLSGGKLGEDAEMLVAMHADGRMEYGPKYEPDAAARQFWDAISSLWKQEGHGDLIERVRAFRAGVEPGYQVPPMSVTQKLLDDVIIALVSCRKPLLIPMPIGENRGQNSAGQE